MKDYVNWIGKKYIIHFANCDWSWMTAEQREGYMQ